MMPLGPSSGTFCRTGYADFPATAVASARREIFDTFGCMLGGSGSPGFDELFAMIRRQPVSRLAADADRGIRPREQE